MSANHIIFDKINSNSNKINELNSKFEEINLKLDKILEILSKDLMKNCKKMGEHIDFVENVYENVKSPLGYICNKVNFFNKNKYSLDNKSFNEDSDNEDSDYQEVNSDFDELE